MKNILLSIACILFFVVPVSGLAAQDGVPVTAEGMAVVTAGNTAIARDQAVNDAQRKAVEQAVGSMVSSQTVMENYEVLSDSVYTKSNG